MNRTRPARARAPAAAGIAALLLATACSTLPPGPGEAVLPLQTAWFEGRVVRYVTTDVSDADVARAKGANHVPALAELLPSRPGEPQRPPTPLARVYAFVGVQQPTVFPAVPLPVGGANASAAYTPLWRMVQVRWQAGRAVRELKSEEAVLDAEERGDVRLTVTDVVLNCPVFEVQGAGALPGSHARPAR